MAVSDKNQILTEAERKAVLGALENILNTNKFEAAPQMSAFLRYIVEETVNGNQSRIKAFTVAVDALGKPDTFDPQNDPVVRVLAGRLRASLELYKKEHPKALMHITMKLGSYVPVFTAQKSETKRTQNTAEEKAPNVDGSTTVILDAKAQLAAEKKSNQHLAIEEESQSKIQHAPKTETNTAPQNRSTSSEQAPPAFKENNLAEFVLSAIQSRLAISVSGLALIAVATFSVTSIQKQSTSPELQAAMVDTGLYVSERDRPKAPSIFISAIDEGDTLQNSLNTIVSGAVSESQQVKIYRILDAKRGIRFWPEDYILSLTPNNLPYTTRVNMQLTQARTGRLVDTQIFDLNLKATEQLALSELDLVINAARAVVDVNGPLLSDYQSSSK